MCKMCPDLPRNLCTFCSVKQSVYDMKNLGMTRSLQTDMGGPKLSVVNFGKIGHDPWPENTSGDYTLSVGNRGKIGHDPWPENTILCLRTSFLALTQDCDNYYGCDNRLYLRASIQGSGVIHRPHEWRLLRLLCMAMVGLRLRDWRVVAGCACVVCL